MSEQGREPGPEVQPIPEPRSVPAASDGDRHPNVLGGVFLIGCGLCLLLVGGGCTGLLLFMIVGSHGGDGLPMLVLAMAMAAGGIVAIVQGFRLARGRRT